MKAYRGSFTKKNGEKREMVFSRIKDLPGSFVAARVIGTGTERTYPEGMELVWDLEADDFRIFNYKTVTDDLKELEVDSSFYLKI